MEKRKDQGRTREWGRRGWDGVWPRTPGRKARTTIGSGSAGCCCSGRLAVGQTGALMKPVFCSLTHPFLVNEHMQGVPLGLGGDPGKCTSWEFPCGRVDKGRFHKGDV